MILQIAVLYGSVREARVDIRLVRFLDAALRCRGHAVAIVDTAEQRLPTDPGFGKRLERFCREFEWYADALLRARTDGAPNVWIPAYRSPTNLDPR